MRVGLFEKKFCAAAREKPPAPARAPPGHTAASPCRPAPAQPPGPESRPRPAHPPQPRAGRLPGTAPNPRQATPAHPVYPKGGSDPYSRPLSDRGPVAREFSRNSGVGVIEKAQPKFRSFMCTTCQVSVNAKRNGLLFVAAAYDNYSLLNETDGEKDFPAN